MGGAGGEAMGGGGGGGEASTSGATSAKQEPRPTAELAEPLSRPRARGGRKEPASSEGGGEEAGGSGRVSPMPDKRVSTPSHVVFPSPLKVPRSAGGVTSGSSTPRRAATVSPSPRSRKRSKSDLKMGTPVSATPTSPATEERVILLADKPKTLHTVEWPGAIAEGAAQGSDDGAALKLVRPASYPPCPASYQPPPARRSGWYAPRPLSLSLPFALPSKPNSTLLPSPSDSTPSPSPSTLPLLALAAALSATRTLTRRCPSHGSHSRSRHLRATGWTVASRRGPSAPRCPEIALSRCTAGKGEGGGRKGVGRGGGWGGGCFLLAADRDDGACGDGGGGDGLGDAGGGEGGDDGGGGEGGDDGGGGEGGWGSRWRRVEGSMVRWGHGRDSTPSED